MTDPAVLNETRLLGSDDQIHAEPARLEAALGPKLLQPRERRGRYDRKGKYVKESTDGDRGLHSEFGEKCRSELLRDNLVSVAPRVCALYVGWYWSMVKSSGATRASLTSRRKCADSARSKSLESLVTDVPFGRSIRTGGISPSAR